MPTLPNCDYAPPSYDGPSKTEVIKLRGEFLTPALVTYYKDPVMFVDGHMQYLFDETGKRYLDGFAGIVSVSVGHCHPRIMQAVQEQNSRLQHTTTIYLHPNIAKFAEKLVSTLPTIKLMQELSKQHKMILVVPIYEVDMTGVYYNTAAVIDEHGEYLGKYRKHHIPHCNPGFWEKFYFKPGNLGYPVFETSAGKIGVYICYDRHFPEGARELGLNGAEIVFNPSATVAGLSEYLWKLEQPAHAVANQYYVGAINRVGTEEPWRIGEFYGQSYFCNPRGQIMVEGSRDKDEVIVADLDLDMIEEVRNTWQFYRDRRPESYTQISKQ